MPTSALLVPSGLHRGAPCFLKLVTSRTFWPVMLISALLLLHACAVGHDLALFHADFHSICCCSVCESVGEVLKFTIKPNKNTQSRDKKTKKKDKHLEKQQQQKISNLSGKRKYILFLLCSLQTFFFIFNLTHLSCHSNQFKNSQRSSQSKIFMQLTL